MMPKDAVVRWTFLVAAALVGTSVTLWTVNGKQGTATIPTASIGGPLPDSDGLATNQTPSSASNGQLADSQIVSDTELLFKIKEIHGFTRVTEKPHLMNQEASGLCGASIMLSSNDDVQQRAAGADKLIRPYDVPGPDGVSSDVHGRRYCDVFVTTNALQTIRSAEGRYPPGALIVKAKYPDGNRQKIELFTVMCKRSPGYSPDHGDWEYCVVDASAAHVLARGKIASCIQCHDDYASTDFVTRAYLK